MSGGSPASQAQTRPGTVGTPSHAAIKQPENSKGCFESQIRRAATGNIRHQHSRQPEEELPSLVRNRRAAPTPTCLKKIRHLSSRESDWALCANHAISSDIDMLRLGKVPPSLLKCGCILTISYNQLRRKGGWLHLRSLISTNITSIHNQQPAIRCRERDSFPTVLYSTDFLRLEVFNCV